MFFNFFRNFFIFPFFVPNGRFFAVFFLAVVEISYARAFACARSLNPALCLVAPFGKTRICGAILCQTCVFAFLPPPLYPLPVRSAGLLLLPLPMARERCASLLSPPLSDKRGGWCAALLHTSPYGKECRTTPRSASPYGKGRCHEVTEGIRVNPQKGRHLLSFFALTKCGAVSDVIHRTDTVSPLRSP